jgi:hypothetical protein|nr:MAG TPA: hypothetical protein [Bacteriophage sp.]
MKELIKKIQKEWQKAKDEAQMICASIGNKELAQKLADCTMFKGTENLEQLIRLMFTPQGIEFLTRYNFPDLATFRKFKKYHPERYGVYIDCGEISLSEARRVFLVGNSSAMLNYRETAGNRVYLMHGARASIIASGYAVVKIENDAKSSVSYITKDKAIVR